MIIYYYMCIRKDKKKIYIYIHIRLLRLRLVSWFCENRSTDLGKKCLQFFFLHGIANRMCLDTNIPFPVAIVEIDFPSFSRLRNSRGEGKTVYRRNVRQMCTDQCASA